MIHAIPRTARIPARGTVKNSVLLLIQFLILLTSCKLVVANQSSPSGVDSLYHQAANFWPLALAHESSEQRPIVIAIVDDGVLTNHNEIKPYLWLNSREIPGNKLDDDLNGFVDDINGWDVADNDNDPRPVPHRNDNNEHGTHLAGVLINALKAVYGSKARDRFRIMPVKVRSDRAQGHYLKSAFKGIEYATTAGADIILAAWGVAAISESEREIIESAYEKDIVLIASAGNLLNESQQFPASHQNVIAVAGTNADNGVLAESNYGQFVDLSAPAEDILGFSTSGPDAQTRKSGTSQAAGLVAAGAALIMDKHSELSAREVRACLVNHTSSFPSILYKYFGKFGSGILNAEASVRCRSLFDPYFQLRPTATRGFLALQGSETHRSLKFDFQEEFAGIKFEFLTAQKSPLDGKLLFKGGDSEKGSENEVIIDTAESWPATSYLVPMSSQVDLRLSHPAVTKRQLVAYELITHHFPTRYCSGTVYLEQEGIIEDGSGENDYSYFSSCKWQIIAPSGKRIRIEFTELDTEPRTDTIYFFQGEETNDPMMAIFSGSDIPPILTSNTNKVLVWFLSNHEREYGGWKANVRFLDQEVRRSSSDGS
ncbi:S8 family serine peptidase [Granulosicoccus sp. 3-233]